MKRIGDEPREEVPIVDPVGDGTLCIGREIVDGVVAKERGEKGSDRRDVGGRVRRVRVDSRVDESGPERMG